MMKKSRICIISGVAILFLVFASGLWALDEAKPEVAKPQKTVLRMLWFPFRIVELMQSGIQSRRAETRQDLPEDEAEVKQRVRDMQGEFDRLRQKSWGKGTTSRSK
ncbi:MAG: hypothetical protein ISS92_01265 [Candidatus Omnitrophica bacterium]|nr:hypothetical protein [Candidatus Omnitrophota bacterium]